MPEGHRRGGGHEAGMASVTHHLGHVGLCAGGEHPSNGRHVRVCWLYGLLLWPVALAHSLVMAPTAAILAAQAGHAVSCGRAPPALCGSRTRRGCAHTATNPWNPYHPGRLRDAEARRHSAPGP